jgi:hypothetical protein
MCPGDPFDRGVNFPSTYAHGILCEDGSSLVLSIYAFLFHKFRTSSRRTYAFRL